MTAERDPSEDRGSSGPEFRAPRSSGPMDVLTREQAEQYVHTIRAASQADIRPRDAAVAWASMDVADALFAIRPAAHQEYTRKQRAKASRAIELIFEARDEILPTKLGHLDREADRWADEMTQALRLIRLGESNVTSFRSRKPQVERGSMEAGQAVEF